MIGSLQLEVSLALLRQRFSFTNCEAGVVGFVPHELEDDAGPRKKRPKAPEREDSRVRVRDTPGEVKDEERALEGEATTLMTASGKPVFSQTSEAAFDSGRLPIPNTTTNSTNPTRSEIDRFCPATTSP